VTRAPASSSIGAISLRRATGESRALADVMPRLVLEARRVASGLVHGLHGRRRAGSGENFWQYRHFASGEPADNVDWRRSGRDDHLYVREREWEATHTVWIWPDRTASMAFASASMQTSKGERALVMALALAELLVQGGERVGLPGLMRPSASRNIIEKMAQAILHDTREDAGWPPSFVPSALSEIVLMSDFWIAGERLDAMLDQIGRHGAHSSLVQILDPAEETFPYRGRVAFADPEADLTIVAGRAESWADAYVQELAAHRASLLQQTRRRGWRLLTHRTDRPASALLLALHAALGQSGAQRPHQQTGPAA